MGTTMLEAMLTAHPSFPAYLHRHALQLYLVKHRRPPATETEQRRAVFEYLTRSQRDKTGTIHVHVSPELEAWLEQADDRVQGWGPVPRLAGLIYQFSRDLRKRYDLAVERDYKEYFCYLALSVAPVLRWPESIVGDAIRAVLWEPAPGVRSASRIGVTRALNYYRRKAASVRRLDPRKIADFSQLLLLVLNDAGEGKLAGYVLSPAQYDYLCNPVKLKQQKVRLTGLLHHLVVERGLVTEHDLNRPEVVTAIRQNVPGVLARLKLTGRLAEAHSSYLAAVTPIGAHTGASDPVPMVTIVGPLSHGSGLGAAARACAEACKGAGIDVEILNHVAGWGRTDEDQGSGEVRQVRGDINIIHFNPDVFIENVSRCGVAQFQGRYNIGFAFWETSKATLAHRVGLDLIDELWVSSEYCRELFQAATDKPVFVARTPVPKFDDLSWASRACFGLAENAFTFIFTFDGASRLTRKNPVATVQAFQQAFPGDDGVRLVIKTQNTERLSAADEKLYAEIRRRAKQDRRILIIDESFSSNEVHGLISVCDCYVSLHRSEGFGFGMAEAMKLRVPVIATGYSGNADFTNENTAYPVRHRLVPVPSADFVYEDAGQEWADPDVDHAAERMIEVRSDPGRATRIQNAHDLVHELYDEAAVGRTYRARIDQIRAELRAGELVANVGT